jgi:hypothetical protein
MLQKAIMKQRLRHRCSKGATHHISQMRTSYLLAGKALHIRPMSIWKALATVQPSEHSCTMMFCKHHTNRPNFKQTSLTLLSKLISVRAVQTAWMVCNGAAARHDSRTSAVPRSGHSSSCSCSKKATVTNGTTLPCRPCHVLSVPVLHTAGIRAIEAPDD